MTAQAPSPPPQRVPAGWSTDPPFGPLADCGNGNPFFYHSFSDDFDQNLGATGLYVLSGTGTAAHTAGDGGLGLFSTTGTAGTFASIQLPAASFTLPPTGSNPPNTGTTVKKLFYLARLQLSDVTTAGFVAGLISTNATPFSAITDGMYFYNTAGTTALKFAVVASAGNSPTGSAVSTLVTIPTTAYTLTNATFIDLAFYITRLQDVLIFAGSQLVGYISQSGTGSVNTAGVSLIPDAPGPCASIRQTITATPFTTAVLSPTLGVYNGATAAVKTMTVDFHSVQKER